ncbi:MAG: ketoacyl-ACP synthase III [Gemmatimonadaceae bacterium]|jgi:3-oxoacyl-[acyl-carrier-protein] synthase-3|nr:ketoacyl-ACP synthase III [Gemmatimonadaceae bacterium]
MPYAAITGWGKCMPPAVLTNDDLATFLETSDEWVASRTGIRERRIAHTGAIELSTVAAARALACAGITADQVDLIIYGGVSNDELVPNSASGVQQALGAHRAASMDLNTACTSFCYGLAAATGMIRSGMIRTAVVIGTELISRYMDWSDRNVAVLFGDGSAAVVLQASDTEEGLLGAALGCDIEGRAALRVRGFGCSYANRGVHFGDTIWDFDGQAIFKRAVHAMAQASHRVLQETGRTAADVDLVVPHQANLRIIEAVAKYAGVPMEKVMVTVHTYGNMSAATVPVALVEALEQGRVTPGATLLMPAFGGGLTYCSVLVKWGARVTPIAESSATLAPCHETGLEIVQRVRRVQDPHGRSLAGLMAPQFVETWAADFAHGTPAGAAVAATTA